MASYELVASRSFDIGNGEPSEGMTFPPEPGNWRVIRIEDASDNVYTGEPTEPHKRLICVIE